MEHIPTEPEQRGRSSAGIGLDLSRTFDQRTSLNEATEILLVETRSNQGFHRALETQERKHGRQEFKHQRPVLQFAPKPPQGCGQNTPVIER